MEEVATRENVVVEALTGENIVEESAARENVERDGVVECTNEWCNKLFSKSANMKRHLKICRKSSEKEKECFLCKKRFKRNTHIYGDIWKHIHQCLY